MDQKNNMIWNVIGNTAYNGSQWLITAAAARLGGFDETGILSAAMSVSLAFRTVTYFGVRNFQVSDKDDNFRKYTQLRIITSVISLIMCIVFCLLSGYQKRTALCVMIYMLFRITEGSTDLLGGALQRIDRLDTAGKLLTLKAFGTSAAFFAVYLINFSLTGALIAMCAASAAILIFAELPVTHRYVKDSSESGDISLSALTARIFPVFFNTVAITVAYNFPKICLSLLSDDEKTGIYTAVFSLAITVQALFQYIYTPYIARYSRLLHQDDSISAQTLMKRIYIALLCASVFFAVIWVFFSETILSAVYGYSPLYKDISVPLMFGCTAYSVMSFCVVTAIAERKTRRLTAATFAGIAVNINASVLLFRLIGINGVSYGMIAASLVMTLILKLPFRRFARREPENES